MKILITGANGFLGQHLVRYLTNKKFQVIATGRGDSKIDFSNQFIYSSLDVTNTVAVKETIKCYEPDIVIHNAAMSKPEVCNSNKNTCLINNVEATAILLNSLKPNTHFIFISSDFIFGEDGPHAENAIPNPLNFYGETKLASESLIKKNWNNFTIVRPVFIYGPVYNQMKPTFLHWVKNNLEQQQPIKVVTDQLRTPTFVVDICRGIESIILQKAMGDFHLAGAEIFSPHQMAIKVAQIFQLNENLIIPANAQSFIEPIRRAKKSGLRIDKAEKLLNYHPISFREGLLQSFFLKDLT
jgi:dTDP-4-dehydrorhamnose reductase